MPVIKTYLPYLGLIIAVALAGCGSSSGDPKQIPTDTGGNAAITFDNYLDGKHEAPLSFEGSCFACHATDGSALLKTSADAAASAEFNLCVSCHSSEADTLAGIPANHVDFVADYAAAKNACSQCHDPHAATKFEQANAADITAQWLQSGHADATSVSFTYSGFSDNCLKCHSGSVFAQTVSGIAAADIDTSGGAQVVACIACHDLLNRDDAGLFALGPIRSIPEVTFPSGAVVSLGASNNLCLECHQGRSSTPTVDARIAAGNLSFANIHYAPAGATLFGSEVQGGYEYPGRNYAGRNTFVVHSAVGVPELTTCTGCHMGGPAEHTFMVPLDRCTDCHNGDSFPELTDQPQFHFERINTLKDQLLVVLEASGVVRVLDAEAQHVFPYFTNISTAAQLKAAYNWQFADKEPGGYIHNGFYIRQLLFDSITDMGAIPAFSSP